MKPFRQKFLQIVKEALAVNNRPFPWSRAIGAGLSMSIPVLIGLLLGNFQYGLIAGMGGFTYLHVFPAPYAQQAKKIAVIVLGITTSAILGTLLAPYPLIVALVIGIITFIALYIFGALRMIGPSAIFFVLIFAIMAEITIDVPITWQLVITRASLIFSGGVLSWLIAMSGFIFKPHGPEESAVKQLYGHLYHYLNSIGTSDFNHARYQLIGALKVAEETLAAGYISWYPKANYNRLMRLAIKANDIYLYTIEHYFDNKEKFNNEWIAPLKPLKKSLKPHKSLLDFPHNASLAEHDSELASLFEQLAALYHAPIDSIQPVRLPTQFSFREILRHNLDRHSLVFLTAMRFAVVTTFSALVAYQFNLVRSYWVPLTCLAVMSGATLVATYHRAIQRSIGTTIGILIAGVTLYLHPNGYIVALLILILTAISELFIVKNYGLAVMFITPSALLIAESITGGEFSFTYFASARFIDTIIGGSIGLAGIAFTMRKTASLRIPRAIMRVLRNQSQFMLLLFDLNIPNRQEKMANRLIKMRTHLDNLRALYDASMGEIPKKPALIEYYWPIIYSIEHLFFLLERAMISTDQQQLSKEELSQLLYLFETLANAARHREAIEIKSVPAIPHFSAIEQEIMTLQRAFQSQDPIPK